jgi:hypothetical protein
MKKRLFGFMTILMMVVVCVCFTACGSDGGSSDNNSGDGGGGGSPANALVGTWSRNYSTADVPNAKEVYTFNNNGSGTYKNAYQTATFAYGVANGYISVKIRYSDSSDIIDDVWSYTINGNTLTLNGNQYKKQ